MRWYNHKFTAAAVVYATTGNVSATGFAVIGSIIPDAVELPFHGLVKHRGLSHWPYLYLIPTFVLGYWYAATHNLFVFCPLFLLVGCCLHLATDALSPRGLPWGRPGGKRAGLRWYRPFDLTETLASFGIVLFGWYGAYLQGFFSFDYLVAEFVRTGLLVEFFGRRLIS